jgi:hypothetical protein
MRMSAFPKRKLLKVTEVHLLLVSSDSQLTSDPPTCAELPHSQVLRPKARPSSPSPVELPLSVGNLENDFHLCSATLNYVCCQPRWKNVSQSNPPHTYSLSFVFGLCPCSRVLRPKYIGFCHFGVASYSCLLRVEVVSSITCSQGSLS